MMHGWEVAIVGGTIATSLILVGAGIGHVRRPAVLTRSLSTSSPEWWVARGAVVWGVLEVVLGVGLLVYLLKVNLVTRLFLLVTGLVLFGYTGWLFHRSRSSQPWCACTSVRMLIIPVTIVRPLVMAVPLLMLLLYSDYPLIGSLLAVELVAGGLVGIGLGSIFWFFPEAIATTADFRRLSVIL